jgi:alpha-galactosidase
MAGTFGYELDPAKMTPEEKEEVKEQLRTYRKYAALIQQGDYYRLSNPFEAQYGAWMFVSEDQSQALLNVVMLEMHGNMTVNYIKLKGLDPKASYKCDVTGKVYSGAALMRAGIPMPVELGEYLAYQMEFQKM